MRLEIEVCFGSQNGNHASLGLAPAARLVALAAWEAAEQSKHLVADIVNEETVPRGFALLGSSSQHWRRAEGWWRKRRQAAVLAPKPRRARGLGGTMGGNALGFAGKKKSE